MYSYKVKYTIKGIGTTETIVSANDSSAASKIVINQNGGKDKVSIFSTTKL
jgi:hypothetical protein